MSLPILSDLLKDLSTLNDQLQLFELDLSNALLRLGNRKDDHLEKKIKVLETVIGDMQKSILYKTSEISYLCKASEVSTFCLSLDEDLDS